ncbi:hypothetical protein JP0079_12610 [Helicobacter pylori]|nr:hypothetical protein JP0079_12610 [Helicobacter pylori]
MVLLVSNTNDFRGVFGEVLDTVKDTFGNLLQLLTNLKNKEIEFDFHKKINYGLPFGIIFITSNSDNPIDIDNKTKKLESCFRDAIKHPFHCPFTIGNYLILDNLKSCFVFQNDSSFNLKQYLLGLKEKLGFELTGIFYCENSNTHKIELIGNDSDFREVLLEFSENIPKAPNEIPQFLTNFKNSKIPNEKISFSPPKDYPSLYKAYGYFKREVKGLKSGKIIGKKIISNAFDLSVSYCFITLDGLKNLKERLFIDIINVINQKKRVALNHAQIDDIQYNVLDSAFYFIFDVGNPSHLAIKVPRKSLENDLHLIDD